MLASCVLIQGIRIANCNIEFAKALDNPLLWVQFLNR
jgi:hypothetical protein